jgi:hypothetical protein
METLIILLALATVVVPALTEFAVAARTWLEMGVAQSR